MTSENVTLMVDGFDGDYIGFQTYFEGFNVSCISYMYLQPPPTSLLQLGISRRSSFDLGDVGINHYPLSHILMLNGFISDMGGLCPHDIGPPDCYAGPKWTPNDPIFFLHHAVRHLHLSVGCPHRTLACATCFCVDGR